MTANTEVRKRERRRTASANSAGEITVLHTVGRSIACLLYTSIHHASAGGADGKLRVGDEIVVQVERDAVKTKAPVLTGNLNFTGRYIVLTAGKRQLGFSSKLSDME